ncbi:sodium channel protein Nach-like isoform X2 [Andrena cerasifolii]
MATKNNDGSRRRAQHAGKLAAISYGWASPVTRKRPAQSGCFQTLIKYFKLYCRHSSLVGLKYLAEDRATWIERILWILVYSCTACVVIYFTTIFYQDFAGMSVATMVEEHYSPTEELEFPGVAVCTMNRLSRRAVRELAIEMLDANITTLGIEEVVESIRQLGDLYDTSFRRDDNYTLSTELFTKMYGKDYDVTNIMKRLTPPCSAVLQLCAFHGELRNCSSLFQTRKTQEGFCCTFNYVDETNKLTGADKNTESLHVYKIGDASLTYGLTVVLAPLLDDYFYRLLPVTGWKVMIFNPHDFPDMASGGVTEILVSPSSEKYVHVRAFGLHSTDAIRSFPIEKRRCFFPREKRSITTTYTGSDCILACKIEDIGRACNCMPFFWPTQGFGEQSYKICSHDDIFCIAQHKNETRNFIPSIDETVDDFMKTESDTFVCPNCYLSCDDVTYEVKSTVFVLHPGYYEPSLLPGINITDQSILRVFFSDLGTVSLKRDETYRWYEYMSDLGGIFAFFVGFSIISIVELFYFSVLVLSKLMEPDPYPKAIEEDEILCNQPSIQAIYWNELLPRSKNDIKNI